MLTDTFFVCPNCGNSKKFTVFTSSFQVIEQSQETGVRIHESSILPNLRQSDNYIECQPCSQRYEYDDALNIGKKHIQATKRFFSKIHTVKECISL